MNGKETRDHPRLQEEVVAILNRWVEELSQTFGEELDAVVVYGSALGPDFVPGRSDINTLVLLTGLEPPLLERMAKVYSRWRRTLRTVPIVLTRSELQRSTDVFPIEYADMQAQHVTLHGPDPLEYLEIAPVHLRLQLERELKSKLIRLREAFLQAAGPDRAVAQLMTQSVNSFLTLTGAALRLRGEIPPADRGGVLERLNQALGLETTALAQVLELKRGGARLPRGAVGDLFSRYLANVRALVQWVDEEG